MGLIQPVAICGVLLALAIAWWLPATAPPPIPRSDAQGCYGTKGWPNLHITETTFQIAGLPPRSYKVERGKQSIYVSVAPGIERVPNANGGGGSYTTGNAAYLSSVQRDTDGQYFWTTRAGPIELLDVAGVVYARTPCPIRQL